MNEEVTTTAHNYDEILKRFVEFAERRQDIRFVMIVGSRAREDSPADEWSDLDLAFATSNPAEYISGDDWLSELDEYILTFLEHTSDGSLVERRVLFEGGFDVDFVPIPLEVLRHGLPSEAIGTIRRGWKVIVDKDSLKPLVESAEDVPLKPESRPEPNDFQQTANDFLYHVVWTAKKLRRGELWTAKQCCDGYLKWRLLKMIEWHAKWVRSDQNLDVWHSGRFLDTWADSRVLRGLADSFAHYDIHEVWAALVETSSLFCLLAREVAMSIGVTYPEDAILKVDRLLDAYRSGS